MDRRNSSQHNTALMNTTELNPINLCALLPLDYKKGSMQMLRAFNILPSEIFYKLESSSSKRSYAMELQKILQ